MQALTKNEAGEWCSNFNLVDVDEVALEFSGNARYEFFVPQPQSFRRIQALAKKIVTFRGDYYFPGALLWLRRWQIGYLESVGWRVIELCRRGQGELRSLEVAPAHICREDEQLELQALLLQVIGYGWLAEYVPADGLFVLRFKPNGQIRVSASSERGSQELRSHFEEFNPTDEDPILVQMAQFKKERDL